MADQRPILVALLVALGTACGGEPVCEDPFVISHGCGLNGRGTRKNTCTDGVWSGPGPCLDPDVCVNGTKEPVTPATCGLNGRGTSSTRTCTAGQWVADCTDPDVCVDGAVEYQFCGGISRQSRQCSTGQWGAYGSCDNQASLTIEAPGRRDMVYDAVNHRLYITTPTEVSTYDLLARKFESGIFGSGSFWGIDLSVDGSRIAAANANGEVLACTPHSSEWGGLFSFDQPPFSVAFTSNTELLITYGSATSMRRFNFAIELPIVNVPVMTVAPETLLARSADNTTVAFLQPGSATGEWGRYQISGRAVTTATAGQPAFEIAVSRTAAQCALATANGLRLFDDAFQLQAVLGQAGGPLPIGVAYSPVADELYLAWAGGSASIDVYSATTFQKLRDIDPAPGLFSASTNRAFVEGRLRVSRDGALLFASVGNGVVAYPTGR